MKRSVTSFRGPQGSVMAPALFLIASSMLPAEVGWSNAAAAPTPTAPAKEAAGKPAGSVLAGYRNHAEVRAALEELTRQAPEWCSLSTYGVSRGGRDLHVLTIANPAGSQPVASRPGMLIVANIDGDHLVGTETAVAVAQRLVQTTTGNTVGSPGGSASAEVDSASADGPANGRPDLSSLSALLRTHAIHIIPAANPDVAERAFAGVQDDHRRGLSRDDADRDGFFDEDGPNDLNGDGLITMMRVYDPDKADMIADPAEPRLNVSADRNRGERPAFALLVEGVDDDGDGEVNEDGRGGVELNRNFPQGWQQYADNAGAFPVSEPEARALVDYLIAHPQIAIVVNYGRPDTLSTPPKGAGRDAVGKPLDIETDDAGVYAFVGERYRDLAGTKKPEDAADWNGSLVAWAYGQHGVWSFSTTLWSRPDVPQDDRPVDDAEIESEGNASADALSDDGGTTSDRRPAAAVGEPGAGETAPGATPEQTLRSMDQVSDETIDALYQAAVANGYQVTRDQVAGLSVADFEMYAQMAGITIKLRSTGKDAEGESSVGAEGAGGGPGEKGDAKPRNAAEAEWLSYSDRVRAGVGFVEWQPYEHPEFGRVEIGGWSPYFRANPPVEAIPDVAEGQVLAIVDLLERMPRVTIAGANAKALADGLYEIEVVLENSGYLPSAPLMGLRNREGRPFVVRLENVASDQLLSGNRVEYTWRIEGSGSRQTHRWLLHRNADPERGGAEAVKVAVFNERYGTLTATIPLPASDR